MAVLRDYQILDTPPEEAYDDITLLASQICGTPIALVSLVDDERQWFKSRVGFDTIQTPRDLSFCAHAILHADEVMEVRDAREDPRFVDNNLVTEDPRIRFYAGAPLRSREGLAMGSLCVIDRVPRELTPAQRVALTALSRGVVAHLELRRQSRDLTR